MIGILHYAFIELPPQSFEPVERSRLHVLPTIARTAIPALDQSVTQARMTLFVVFDLDGTLALSEHPAQVLNRPGKEKDWRGSYAACDRDEPCIRSVASRWRSTTLAPTSRLGRADPTR